jgi:hypothetical protein
MVKGAIVAGTFEAHPDNHFGWSLLRLDQRGWEMVTAAVDALLALVFEEWEASEARIADSGETPIATTTPPPVDPGWGPVASWRQSRKRESEIEIDEGRGVGETSGALPFSGYSDPTTLTDRLPLSTLEQARNGNGTNLEAVFPGG